MQHLALHGLALASLVSAACSIASDKTTPAPSVAGTRALPIVQVPIVQERGYALPPRDQVGMTATARTQGAPSAAPRRSLRKKLLISAA